MSNFHANKKKIQSKPFNKYNNLSMDNEFKNSKSNPLKIKIYVIRIESEAQI